MKRSVQGAAAGALAAMFVALALPAAAETLRFHYWLPPQHPLMARTMIPWFEQVTKATEGRVKVEVTAAPLGPPPAQFDLVKNGAVDLAMNVHGFTPGRFKASQIGELPFLSKHAEPLSVALWRAHEKFFEPANEYEGVKLITLFAGRPGALWSPGEPMRSIDDWKGKKIFCGVKSNCVLAERLDAVPVQKPGPQVYEMLQRKIVDAAFIDYSSYKDFNLAQFIRSVTEAPKGFYAPTFYVVMNKKAWDALSEADRKAIDAISGETFARRAGINWDDASQDAIDLLKENKVERVMADGEYLKQLEARLVPPAEKEYAESARSAGVDGKAALDFLRAEIDREAQKLTRKE